MMMMASLNKIEKAHQMYRDGRHEEALDFYTESLSLAKTKAQKIALHSNRAACYLKLHDFKKAAEECTLVLELDHSHTGALMLRAQTLVTLKEYQSALFDVNRLMELNPSSDVYQNLQARLKTQLSLAPIPECEEEPFLSELKEEDVEEIEEEEEEEKVTVVVVEERKQQEESVVALGDRKTGISTALPNTQAPASSQTQSIKDCLHSEGCKEIPTPKGHSRLDYSRWDRVEDDSSEEDDEEESLPQYRFRVRTVGVRPVK
ncbi:hypothetical protein IFM89_002624 [Coptis chinensis]|uniref:Uncharacterized protein n=1 Tax=Coptis chinensis TaxID=261450 RepID=A0A835GYB3_9MAGN|nr:hypothetical protein IFM89_002624 [Coptis chinensis]